MSCSFSPPLPSHAKRPGRLPRILAFNLLLLGGSLLAAELVLRLAGVRHPAFYRPDWVRGYTLRPGASGLWSREGRGQVTVNREGLRDREHSPQAAPGVLRVAVLGDSFTEALQVNLEQTWWKQLEQRINATPGCAFRKGYPGGVEFLNFGVGGYGTGEQLLTWRHQARSTAPGIVLVAMYLGNDIRDNTPQPRPDRPVFRLDPRGELAIDNGFRDSSGSRWRFSPPGRLLDALVNRSSLLQLANEAKNRWAARRPAGSPSEPAVPEPEPDDPRGWTLTAALLRTLQKETSAAGSTLIVTSLSTPEQLWPDRAARQVAHARAGLAPFAREQRLAGILASLGIPYLPLAQELQEQVDREGRILHGFPGPQEGRGHWNPTGHRLAAEELARRLCAAKP